MRKPKEEVVDEVKPGEELVEEAKEEAPKPSIPDPPEVKIQAIVPELPKYQKPEEKPPSRRASRPSRSLIRMEEPKTAVGEMSPELKERKVSFQYNFDGQTKEDLNTYQKVSKPQSYLQGRLALSKQSSRFELPMDMKCLETMTPQDYLRQFCIISGRRYTLYQKIFLKHKDRSGGLLNRDLQRALRDVLINTISPEDMEQMFSLAQVDDNCKVDLKLFSGIAALAERVLYPKFLTEDTQDIADHQKEKIECADFCALEWKFHGVNVNPDIRRILESL